MSRAPRPTPALQVSCAVCELLHAPVRPDASHPVCSTCARTGLPAGRRPLGLGPRRGPLDTR